MEFDIYLPPQSSWIISVELAIGPEEGISYLTDKGSMVSMQTTHLTRSIYVLGDMVVI